MKKYILLLIALFYGVSSWADVDEVTLNNPSFITDVDDVNLTASFYVWDEYLTFTSDVVKIPETIVKDEKTYRITKIRSLYFNANSQLDVILPDNAVSIELVNNDYIRGVKTIELSKGVHSVNNLHYNCIQEFKVADDSPYFSVDDNGVLYNKDKTKLCYAPYGNHENSKFVRYEIPATVTEIGDYAFYHFSNTDRVTCLGNSIMTIGVSAFQECYELVSFVSDNTSLITIKDSGFESCNRLTNFTFSDNIQRIEYEAFYNTRLSNTSFTLPKELKYLDEASFCNAFEDGFLQKLIIPKELNDNMSSSAFRNNVFRWTSVNEVYSYIEDPKPVGDIFYYTPGKIYIPTNSKSNYTSTAGWSNWSNQYEELASLLPESERTGVPAFALSSDKSTLSISSTTEGATIYYTTDGSEATLESNVYNGEISISHNMTVNAIAVKDGLATTKASFTVDWFILSDVTIEPYVGSDGSTIFVKMYTNAPDATIKYIKGTTWQWDVSHNASDFETSGIEYDDNNRPSVDENCWIYAYAVKDGYFSPNSVTDLQCSASGLRCNNPVIDKNTKEDGTIIVTMSCSTEGATIYYTTGSDDTPTRDSENIYSGPITVTGNFTYRAIAVKDGVLDSYQSNTVSISNFRATRPNVDIVASYNESGAEVMKAVVTGSGDPREVLWYRIGDSGDFLPYTSPVTVLHNDVFYAHASILNWNDSENNGFWIYSYNYRCDSPTFTPDRENRQVTINCNTPGAKIYYTLDGSTPDRESSEYLEPITLDKNCTVRAFAVKENLFDSNKDNSYTASGWFVCDNVVAELEIKDGLAKVKLTCTTPDVTIRYGVNTTYDPSMNDYPNEPIEVASGNTVYAIATKEGYDNSTSWTSFEVNLSGYTHCSMPSIFVDDNARNIEITTSDEGGVIYYTLDGTTPTKANGTLYEGKFTPQTFCTVKAVTYKDDCLNSDVAEYALTEWFRLENVVFEPQFDSETGAYKMKMSHPEDGVTIMYYTDENRWSENPAMANEYDGSVIAVDLNTYVHAYAKKEGKVDSYWSFMYINEDNYTVSRPSIQTNGETKTVTMSSSTPDAIIYYTLDGTDPASSETKKEYKESFAPGGNITIKAVAVKAGMNNSSVEERNIYDWYYVSNVVMDFYVKDNELMCELSTEDKEEGVTLYYSAGDWGSLTSTNNYTLNSVYTGPFKINRSLYVSCAAVKENYNTSVYTNNWVNMGSYTCNSPEITARSTDSTVVISCSTEGATIYYTSDGTDPIVDAKYKYVDGTELKLDHNCTFKAIAAKDKMFNSSISERRISDWFRCENVAFEQFLDGKQPKMRLTSTSGSTIYYSFNGWNQDSVYKEPFAVANGQYVYAIAYKENFNNSDWREQYVSYDGYDMCAAPTISANSDTHTITISTSDGKGKIYYTLDGSNPTTADRLYTEAFTLTENCTIKAITVNDSLVNSSPAYYNVDNWFYVERVNFIPSFVVDGDKTTYKVCLKTNTEDAVIYYSIGARDYYNPENNALYTDGDTIMLAQDQTVYAIAVRKGYNNSGWGEFIANLDGCTLSMYDWTTDQENKKVYFHASVDDAKLYYTIDGTEPTVESLAYDPENGLDVKGNWEIKVMAAKVGMVNSESRTYRIDGWFRVSDVVVELYGEGDAVMAKLSTKDNEEDAKIYYYIGDWYSFDQNDLKNNSIWTGEPFKVTNGKYLQVMATKDAYSNSTFNQYWIDYDSYRCGQPSIITNKEDSTVTFRCSTEGATIYYTTDESDPTTSNTRKSCSNNYQLKLTSNAMIKAYAVKDQYLNSSVNEAWVSNWYYVSNIVYTPYVEDNKLMMKLSTEKEENDVTIYYYQGGWSDFDTETLSNNIVYSGPFEVNSGKYISVMATKAGYNNSSFARESFNAGSYTCAQPSIISNQGDSTVTFRCSTEGALIYYTTDDSDPTISTTVKSAKSNTSMKLDKNCTIKAYAAKSGLMASNSNEITISSWFNVSKIVFDPYVEGDLLKMRLSTENNESDVTIYYKVDSNYDAFDSNNLSNNNVYDNTKPFVVSDGAYVHAMAVKAGYNNTSLYRIRYNYSSYTCSQPTITTNSVDTTATIRCSTTGAVVYYTLDGSDPATSTTRVKYANSAFKLTQNCTIKAIAMKDDMMNSSASSLAYNSLKAATPEITLNGTTVTITSSTPNAVLYYAFGDDKTASEESNKYTGPFTLPDNRRISAIATRQGWNNSDSRNYYPSGVVKCPLVKKVSFDGHYMTLSTVEGATIYYRTDGQEPNTWNSSVYEGPIEINQVGTVKAKATHPYMTESDVVSFEIEAYSGDTGATTKEAGGLEASMGWADPATITEFAISGPINSNDMSFIKNNMTSLEKLDLSDATAEGGILPDNAFSGLPLVTFLSPNALKSVGKNIFSGCKELAAVIWNTTAKIPNDAFDDDANPNLLLFVPAADVAPNASSVRNIIVNNTADNIYLSDGANNNFYSPKQFYTKSITYTHDFTLTTGPKSGWETICLPFECSYFVHESKGELKPFAEYNSLSDKGNYKPFWLCELTDIGYQDVKKIEANKPYLISMPNNEFASDAWFDCLVHADREAKRLGIELCIANCSGWTSSGGPWITPELFINLAHTNGAFLAISILPYFFLLDIINLSV